MNSGASSHAEGAAPLAVLHLWPYRSLPRRGFVIFIGATFALLSLPLIAALGTPVLWGLLPFVLGAVGLTWYLIERSYKDGEILEELRLWPDRIELTRHEPRGPVREWHANPYWIAVIRHGKGAPVEHYLTLRGGPREVEIGAFLTPEERLALKDELEIRLAALPRIPT
ncbi:DUF2244 domain-containing protein [Actibacterium sp. XHP0104]|nr:DUF2244 domain-containing protein [Actibacterium sp. XHP0104]MCV2882543.1 DUF2244 domain-containing protein [Actibacterium sp. XHP0104]